MNDPTAAECPIRRVDPGEGDCFFGYYDLQPFAADGRRLLMNRASIGPRRPLPGDTLDLLLVDSGSGEVNVFGKSDAWDWQMGCRMQWLDESRVIHNDRRDGRVVSVIRDVTGGEEAVLPRGVIDLNVASNQAVTLNFGRLDACRPGYGVRDTGYEPEELAPDDDGVFRMDLATGESELIASLKQMADLAPVDGMDGGPHWVNHLMINPSGTRLIFLHRWGPLRKHPWTTRMLTCGLDGGDLRILNPEPMTSHCCWLDDRHVLTWCEHAGRAAYWLFDVTTGRAESFGDDWFDRDGHCSFSPRRGDPEPVEGTPDRRWLLTDCYPHGTGYRVLMLYRWPNGPRHDIGRFLSDPEWDGPNRCDLHPRWSRDGRAVCIDSTHQRERGVYVIDVSEIVAG